MVLLNVYDLPEPAYVRGGRKIEHPEGYGIYFQQRWDEAIQGDPQFLYQRLNEWIVARIRPWATPPSNSCAGQLHYFVDQA
jgi:hypothetical protein